MKNEKFIKFIAKVSYAFRHPIKKVKSLFVKEDSKLNIFDKLKLRRAEKNSDDIRIWNDEKFDKILENLRLKKKARVVPKVTSDEQEEMQEIVEKKSSIDFENINVEQAVVAYLENAVIDNQKISKVNEMLDNIKGKEEKENQLKSFIKNNINNDKDKKLDLLMLMLEKISKEEKNENTEPKTEEQIMIEKQREPIIGNKEEKFNEKEDTKVSALDNFKRIQFLKQEISRLEKCKSEVNSLEGTKVAKEETIKHYDEETKKLRDQIKEIIDNNKYTNEVGREISMEERDRFDRLDDTQAQIIETIKKQKQINSEFNEAWYGHMGEKPTEDLLKRRAILKNELDAINIKLKLLKQQREEIVAEKPIKWYKAM